MVEFILFCIVLVVLFVMFKTALSSGQSPLVWLHS
nr:MAG TPA: hypothetical protein [Caudoviricetes sp.]